MIFAKRDVRIGDLVMIQDGSETGLYALINLEGLFDGSAGLASGIHTHSTPSTFLKWFCISLSDCTEGMGK